jgi:hypothetical protein
MPPRPAPAARELEGYLGLFAFRTRAAGVAVGRVIIGSQFVNSD